MTVVDCPTCKRKVEWKPENRHRPFCSERCRQIDLGAWAAGDYALPADDDASRDETVPIQPTNG